MGAVPWCGAGFPLEMSPAHRGTAPEGLDLNYGWNFLLILYPEEYQIPDREGWEDAEGGEFGKMDLLGGKHSHHGQVQVLWGGVFVSLPSSSFGLGADVGTRIPENNPNPTPLPIPTAGSRCRQVLLRAGWVLHNFRKSRSRI